MGKMNVEKSEKVSSSIGFKVYEFKESQMDFSLN